MNFSLYTIKRIQRVLIISIVTSVALTFFSIMENKGFEDISISLIVGFLLGIPVGILEEFVVINRFNRYPFFLVIIIKGIFYTIGVGIFFILFVWFYVLAGSISIERFMIFLIDGEFLRAIIYTLTVFDFVIVFNQYQKLLGTDVMLFYAYGKYQQPEHEKRIFMFLDISSSTELAETMKPDNYFSFINEFFHDISEPLLNSSAHIYQYVGDEVVFTWKIKDGIKNNNCVNLFFLIEEVIKSKENYYIRKYGCIPKFKAGLHCGQIIAAVVGDIKKELIYNGDVLNTTSRIRSHCTEINKKFLASSEIISLLPNIDEKYEVDSIGVSQLKGKKNVVGLFSIIENTKITGM